MRRYLAARTEKAIRQHVSFSPDGVFGQHSLEAAQRAQPPLQVLVVARDPLLGRQPGLACSGPSIVSSAPAQPNSTSHWHWTRAP
jgi:hypothetical protein